MTRVSGLPGKSGRRRWTGALAADDPFLPGGSEPLLVTFSPLTTRRKQTRPLVLSPVEIGGQRTTPGVTGHAVRAVVSSFRIGDERVFEACGFQFVRPMGKTSSGGDYKGLDGRTIVVRPAYGLGDVVARSAIGG
jgi:hypothetical protein